jgi:alkaline phosphatase D
MFSLLMKKHKIVFLLLATMLSTVSCSHLTNKSSEPEFPSATSVAQNKNYPPGYLPIIQGPTTDTKTTIALMTPRLKKYSFQITNSKKETIPFTMAEPLSQEKVFWRVEKLFLSNLDPKETYKLEVMDEFRGNKLIVDTREFKTLNINTNKTKFALMSCMSDDYKFRPYIPRMWDQLKSKDVDFIILDGDVVYIDGFEFAPRKTATPTDIWQRYIDSFQIISLYHWEKLKPIFATWDDHDFGTNDGDATFPSKKESQILFRQLFWGAEMDKNYKTGPEGVFAHAKIFGQNFYFMDDRSERKPNKGFQNEKYGHWGKAQHEWLVANLKNNPEPSWIINGNQVFNFKVLEFKEAMQMNHSSEFDLLMSELKTLPQPIGFLSGDVHFTEITATPKELLGYESFEITSSSMHSYHGNGWDNNKRVPGTFVNEFNFVVIESSASSKQMDFKATSWGLAKDPYFSKTFTILNQQ